MPVQCGHMHLYRTRAPAVQAIAQKESRVADSDQRELVVNLRIQARAVLNRLASSGTTAVNV